MKETVTFMTWEDAKETVKSAIEEEIAEDDIDLDTCSGVGRYFSKGGLQYRAYNKVREANLIFFIM